MEEGEGLVSRLINSVNTVGKGVVRPYVAVLKVNGKSLKMEVDTGAAVTLISQATWKSMFPYRSDPESAHIYCRADLCAWPAQREGQAYELRGDTGAVCCQGKGALTAGKDLVGRDTAELGKNQVGTHERSEIGCPGVASQVC